MKLHWLDVFSLITYLFIIIAVGVGLSIGTTSLIANALGANDKKKSSYF